MEKDKIFTKEELKKVEELTKDYNNLQVAEHFNLTDHKFTKLKKSQPELGKAYTRGVKARKRGVKLSGHIQPPTKPQRIRITEDDLNNRVSNDLPLKEALKKFYEIKEQNDMRRLRKELKNIDLL